MSQAAASALVADFLPPVVLSLFAPEAGNTEVWVNADGVIRVDQAGVGVRETGVELDPAKIRGFLNLAASAGHRRLDLEDEWLAVELPKGSPFFGARLQAELPPIVSEPVMTIRLHHASAKRLEDYPSLLSRFSRWVPRTESAVSGETPIAFLRSAVAAGLNFLVVGGTNSGKTTFGNALLAEIPHSERVVILEDRDELVWDGPDQLKLLATERTPLEQLLMNSLRHRPRRIFVGEVRGPEAGVLLDAWQTGHRGGIATVHADGCVEGLKRFDSLAQRRAGTNGSVMADIAAAVDLVVMLERPGPSLPPRPVQLARVKAVDAFPFFETEQLFLES